MVILSWYRYWYLDLFLILLTILCVHYLLIPPEATLPEPGSPMIQVDLATKNGPNLFTKPLEDETQIKPKDQAKSKHKKASQHVVCYSTLKGSVEPDAVYRWYEDNCSIKEQIVLLIQ